MPPLLPGGEEPVIAYSTLLAGFPTPDGQAKRTGCRGLQGGTNVHAELPGAQGGPGSNAGQGRRRLDVRRRGDSDPKLLVLGPRSLGEGMII